MKTNAPVLAFVILIGFIIGGIIFGGIQSNSDSVNSSPESIIACLSMSVFAIWFPRKDFQDIPNQPIGLLRRFIAVNLDLLVAVSLLVSISILPILYLEYLATGEWQWSYERTDWATRDLISFVQVLAAFYGLYYFFYKHAENGKPTPGQYIMGYRIAPAKDGEPDFVGRSLLGFFAFCLSIFTLIKYSHIKDGIYPWDRKTNTQAVAITD